MIGILLSYLMNVLKMALQFLYLCELLQCVRAGGRIQWSETERRWWRAF